MKTFPGFYLVLLLFICSFSDAAAQNIKNYDALWKVVDDLTRKKKLPKSALEEVRKIYALAKKEGQPAQQVKALVYMLDLQQQTREDNLLMGIKELDREISHASGPTRALLQSLQAGHFLQYLQQHRYQLYGRTNTAGFNKDDVATWTLEDLHKRISDLFLQSLSNTAVLQQTKLEPYDAIIQKGNMRHLRPTLYDLLAHHALQYFKSGERDMGRPAYAFAITQPEALADPEVFAATRFHTADSLSMQHKALLIFQELSRLHLGDAAPDALIDLTLDRLEYTYRNAVMEEKDSLYADALKRMINRYPRNGEIKQASFMLAQYHEQRAMLFQTLKDTSYRYERRKAREILEPVVRDSAQKTEGWANSFNLLQEIDRREFSFEVEKVNLPQQPFRALVRYRNMEALQFRIVALDHLLKQNLKMRYDNRYWETIAALKAIRSWHQTLPVTTDLQQHAVEIKIDALPVGEYLLVAEDTKGNKNKMVGAQAFSVSNISYVTQGREYFVLHRETGQPLEGASVQLFRNNYDYTSRKYTQVKASSGTTDGNGYFAVAENSKVQNNSLAVHIFYRQDSLTLDDEYYTYHSTKESLDTIRKTFFFTDRSVYRPGQTVFFKAISLQQNGKERNLLSHVATRIILFNANGEPMDSLSMTTNEYGSVAGKFALPQHVLNGQFSIRSGKDQSYFSVEEYKRPKFFVAFEKLQTGYRVGDSITLHGNAKAYAGNNISNATVKYRVVRQPRFFYPWLTRGWLPRTEPMEIAQGVITSDAAGRFAIRFKAIPDLKLDPQTDPLFDYRVYADVTDLNGETRSATETVTSGYRSILLKVTLEKRMHKDSLQTLSVRTENLAGAFQPATVSVTIRQLMPEQRLIRHRYWQQPDQFLYTKEEFIHLFPNDAYSNEEDMASWQKGAVVFEKRDSSRVNGIFSLAGKNFATGWYEVAVTTLDASGKEVKDIRYTELFDANTTFSKPEFIWVKGSNKSIEPGESTTVQLGSAAQDVFMVQQLHKNNHVPQGSYSFIRLHQEKKSIPFAATEADRGGFGVAWFFVKSNRLYQFSDIIQVPWTNKELKVEWSTFRDKSLPASEEKWKVKISGYKGEQAAAEMLASMYDASLDQFQPHQWTKPSIWPVYNNRFSWNGMYNFSAIPSQQKWAGQGEYREVAKSYDQLVFNMWNDVSSLRRELQGKVSGVGVENVLADATSAAPPPMQEQAQADGSDVKLRGNASADTVVANGNRPGQMPLVQPRTHFNETAFFFPQLNTDASGNIEFSFTTPEALTTWKLQTFSHTKNLSMGMALKELVTQKELMVQPNAPRFLREGDRIEFTSKIVNMGTTEITGQAQLQLMDAATGESVDGWFQNIFPNQYFTVAADGSEVVRFPVEVPYLFGKALSWRIVATAGNKSDGEEQSLPVLTNKMLVTETLPLPMQGSGTKNFSFENLLTYDSETLQHHAVTVEFTTNPAWLAVQALPYMAEPKQDNAEQMWNRYFAHALAQTIISKAPKLKTIFETWKGKDTAALLSNLQKNGELKAVLLEETPWVLQAKTEAEQKRNMSLLFDLSRMTAELKGTLEKLKEFQSENGGFVWLKGGPDDRYMTQYIITGIGHLKQLGGDSKDPLLQAIAKAGLAYLDKRITEDYNRLLRAKAKLSVQQPGNLQVQYLYMRSFFTEHAVPKATQPAYDFYRRQAKLFWTKQSTYLQGMIALHLKRTGDVQTPAAILKSLKETAIQHEELGMYWKEYSTGRSWYWWTAPIEAQALMIEVFSEIGRDVKTVDALKTWLLKNKQTTNWKTTRATAESCYALLLQGSDWLNETPSVQLTLGNTIIASTASMDEAGTGYFKRTIPAQTVRPETGNIKVTVASVTSAAQPSWGAVYWQYFESLDRIKTAATPLQLSKKLFVEKNSDRGPVLVPVLEGDQLKVGDKIKVRIELRVDRDMEYVHMKDMRAAALEPVNVLSGYKWQGGLGYYESTKDASTQFFFDYLRKGTYVFEYALFVTLPGNFSNGITTIQSYYAPEFAAHSEGVRISVE